MSGGTGEFDPVGAIALGIVCASAAVGHRWALRTHDSWLIRRLAARLSEADRKALIELTMTLQGPQSSGSAQERSPKLTAGLAIGLRPLPSHGSARSHQMTAYVAGCE